MPLMSALTRFLVPLLTGLLVAACGGDGASHDAARAAPAAAAAGDTVRTKARAAAADATAPFTGNGWYWNPQEGGTGFMVEAQGSRVFVGFFMYEEGSGNPVWYVTTGDLLPGAAAGDHRYTGDLLVYHGGMGLTDRTWRQPTARSLGTVSIDFVGGRASVAFPGGRVMQAERFCAGGPCTTDPGATPFPPAETGWYWNPAEGGRGYAIETHGANSYIGIFHYNPDGSPVWHIVPNSGDAFQRIELYTGGQSLGSAYRPPTGDVLSGIRLNFRSPCAGQLQVLGAPPVSLRRFVIDDTRPAGEECRALATLADVPDVSPGLDVVPSEGDLVHGVIDTPDDADAYRVYLNGYNKTITVDLMGAASGAGTLANPRLGVYDANLALIADNDDRDATTTDAQVRITVPFPGFYTLRVSSSSAHPGTGSFLLKLGGIDPSMREAPLLPVADYQGAVTGRLRGTAPAQLSLTMEAGGTVSGVMTFLPPAAQRVPVSGTVAPDGVLDFSGTGPGGQPLNCRAAVINGGLFGGCGQAGMLTGQSITRTADAYGAITVPASATVGQAVQMATTEGAGPYPATHAWDFGDGTTAVGAVPPPHVYARPGPYTVTVQVKGGSAPAAPSFARATVMVFCADGTLCTDLAEPAPSVAIEAAACTLRTLPPDEFWPFAQGPLITFSARASGSSSQRLMAFASGNRRVSEAQIRQSLQLFGYWDQQSIQLACDGRDPCRGGPFDTVSDSPARRTGPYLPLQSLWEQRPLGDPQPAWLYVVLVDQAYSQVLAVAEQPLTCPGHLGLR